jgi:hypothetical protein
MALLEQDGRRRAYRLTTKGVQLALLFLFFHKRLCGALADSQFHHRLTPPSAPTVTSRPLTTERQIYSEHRRFISRRLR